MTSGFAEAAARVPQAEISYGLRRVDCLCKFIFKV